MKTRYGKMTLTTLTAAVQGALLAMCATPAQAQDATVEALTTPDNYVEVGAAYADKQSAKFGEYTGLNKSEATAVVNFDVKGGDYGSDTGTTRWSATGRDLGLTSRELGATYGNQGLWNVGFGYDELRHNTTDGYQTPYDGSVGGNSFTLPAGFGTTANTVTALSAAQQAALHTVDVNNTRKNTSLATAYHISPQWRVTLDYNNLEQSGAKLMGFASDPNLGGGVTGERIAILPNPTNYTTDTVSLAVDWAGERGHLTASYFGSFFKDHYDQVNWTTFAGANATDVMPTAPNNELHQLNLAGGYKLSSTMKLTGGLSYGQNTQDSAYVATPASLVSIPSSSLNGKVDTTHANLKLVDQTTKDLRLSAAATYNKRDNKTTSGTYTYHAINSATGTPYEIPNTPYSNDKAQIELAGDYRLGAHNKLRVAYNHDDTKRWCNSYGVSVDFPAGTNCLVDTKTKEDKLSLGYKLSMMQAVDLSVGYSYGERKTTYDTSARVALDSIRGGTILDPFTAGTIIGLNGGDYLGFHPLYDASRKQQVLKMGMNWQAAEAFSLGINTRYTDDNYTDATFGAQDGKSWNVNLDATYNFSDEGAVFAYVASDYRDRYIKHVNRSNTTTGAYIWGDRLKDEGLTYGLGFKQGGLLGGKIDLKGDLSYSDNKSNYSSEVLSLFTGGTYNCSAATALTCGSAPDIRNKLTQVKLTGGYKIDKQSKVAVGYLYQKLSSTDYFYDAYSYSYTATSVLPTNQLSGSYKVNLVAASYIYSFK